MEEGQQQNNDRRGKGEDRRKSKMDYELMNFDRPDRRSGLDRRK